MSQNCGVSFAASSNGSTLALQARISGLWSKNKLNFNLFFDQSPLILADTS